MIKANIPPDKHTFGMVGDKYLDQSTNTVWVCTAVSNPTSDYGFIDVTSQKTETSEYTWENASGGDVWLSQEYFTDPNKFAQAFSGSRFLAVAPKLDTSSATSLHQMFSGCSSLTTVPEYDTSNVENMGLMFRSCTSLVTAPMLDTSNVVEMEQMFANCSSLTTVPAYDLSSVYNVSEMFTNCTSLVTAPAFDTSNVQTFSGMFYNCTALTTVPEYDLSSANGYSLSGMFSGCTALTTVLLRNIGCDLDLSASNNLMVDCIISIIGELRNPGDTTTQKLTLGETNLDKISDVYVKTIDITDDMRAEDEYIDQKLPFEICASTDEGATSLVEYAASKRWNIV